MMARPRLILRASNCSDENSSRRAAGDAEPGPPLPARSAERRCPEGPPRHEDGQRGGAAAGPAASRLFDRAALGLILLSLLPAAPAWAVDAFQESGGQVVMEAERYDAKIARSGKDWTIGTSKNGYSGTSFLQCLPNAGSTIDTGYVTTSPELKYNVQFSTTGTYYVWLRGLGPTTNDDSIHAGIDGTGPSSADRITLFLASWTWSRTTSDASAPATVTVSSPGLHTIHLWMREDGFIADKILLRTSSSSTAPSGTGPAESPRITLGTDTTPPSGTITINSGAALTNNVAVTLTLSATDPGGGTVSQMQFSNDGASYSAAETYATTKSWTLAGGDGTKTVSVKFKDAAGNWSSPVSDGINLDTTPPAITITLPADGAVFGGGP